MGLDSVVKQFPIALQEILSVSVDRLIEIGSQCFLLPGAFSLARIGDRVRSEAEATLFYGLQPFGMPIVAFFFQTGGKEFFDYVLIAFFDARYPGIGIAGDIALHGHAQVVGRLAEQLGIVASDDPFFIIFVFPL